MEEIIRLINEGKYSETLDKLKNELDKRRDDPELYYLIGLVNFKLNNFRKALINLEKAIKIKSNDARYHLLYAYTLYQLGYDNDDEKMIKRALKEIEIARQLDQSLVNDPGYHYYLANILYELDKYNEALEEINKALGIKDNKEFHKLRGDILFQLKRYEEAIKEYETDLEKDENLYAIAHTYFTLGDYERAINYFNKAISINSENPYYYEGKARALFLLGKINEAYEEIKRAIEIDPDNPYIKATEIEILSEIRVEDAIRELKEYLDEMDIYKEILCEEIRGRKISKKAKEYIDEIITKSC